MPKPQHLVFCAIFSFFMGAFAKNQPIVLYMSGDYFSLEYHLGVLSEIERLQIPVDTIVGTQWGAFAGALWSAGWSSGQIRELVKSWDSLPRAKQPQNSALWKGIWLVKHNENGAFFLEEITDSKPYFGQLFFDLRVQESLLRSNPGSKIPFRKIDDADNYPFPPVNTSLFLGTSLLSTPLALRDTNGTVEQHYQQKLWNEDSTLIILRPHSKPNPDLLFEAGVQAVQNKRSIFSKFSTPNSQLSTLNSQLPTLNSQLPTPNSQLPTPNSQLPTPNSQLSTLNSQLSTLNSQLSTLNSQLPTPNSQLSTPNSQLSTLNSQLQYNPVFDSTAAELQGHLKSFWNPGDTGIIGVKNFLENLQKDASYRDLKMIVDSNYSLQINTDNHTQLSLSLFGFGGSIFGANIGANANLRFVNQFGWNLNLAAFYGQGVKGLEPELRLERIFMGDGDFFAKAKYLEYEPIPFFQRSIYEEARLINESNRNIVLGVEKPLGRHGKKSVLQVAAEIESKDIISGASKFPIYEYDDDDEKIITDFLYEPITVKSMFPYIKWLWQSDGYNRWFAKDGFMAELLGGLKAVSVITLNQSTPLYISTQGKTGITQPVSRYVSINGGTEFGANFRMAEGKLVLPDELYGTNGSDPALENRYRFAMGMGNYMEEWQTSINSSHCYGIVFAGFSLQWHGSGIFLTGGFGTKEFFAEPKIRIKTQTFDFVLGQSIIYSAKSRIFLNIQSGNF